MRPLPFQRFREVLVIRTDHLGDLVLSTPFLRALRQALPEARISALVTGYTRGVLDGSGFVDELLTALPSPKHRRYDLAVCLAPRTRSYRTAFRSRAPYRVGYVYTGRPLAGAATHIWLTHRLVLPIRTMLARGQRVPHEVEQLGQLADAMGLDYRDRTLVLPVSQAAREAVAQRLHRGKPVLALHLHASWLRQGWSCEDLAGLLRALAARHDGLLVSYGPSEAELAHRLRPALDEIDWLGELSVAEWAAALELTSCVISTDTGAVHVAAAVKRPVAVVFKPESYVLNSQQWAPWQVPHRSLVHRGPEVTIPEILRAVDELVDGSPAAPAPP
ncbi:MAG: glycosyltransferase family 9 protein [Armatimonadetes bacterium]|nr:glycosyltransferase family 9 protein [Armatimonadota bacterium]